MNAVLCCIEGELLKARQAGWILDFAPDFLCDLEHDVQLVSVIQ